MASSSWVIDCTALLPLRTPPPPPPLITTPIADADDAFDDDAAVAVDDVVDDGSALRGPSTNLSPTQSYHDMT